MPTPTLRLFRLACRELDQIATHYNRKQPGLGMRFLVCFRQTMRYALDHPEIGPRVEHKRIVELGLHVRRMLVNDFPYEAVTAVFEDELFVLAVAHQARRPHYWIRRLAKIEPGR